MSLPRFKVPCPLCDYVSDGAVDARRHNNEAHPCPPPAVNGAVPGLAAPTVPGQGLGIPVFSDLSDHEMDVALDIARSAASLHPQGYTADPNWIPHDWVTVAIVHAYRIGEAEGLAS